jgi:hypothetical protein
VEISGFGLDYSLLAHPSASLFAHGMRSDGQSARVGSASHSRTRREGMPGIPEFWRVLGPGWGGAAGLGMGRTADPVCDGRSCQRHGGGRRSNARMAGLQSAMSLRSCSGS